MNYDKDAVTEKFKKGKSLLDSGYNDHAIAIFSDLIDQIAPWKDTDKAAEVTWDTALNNRGVARCRKAYSEKNKPLFEEGMKDLQAAFESVQDLEERKILTAFNNLKFAEQQLADFDNPKPGDFKSL
jgi:hypothetical protein